MDSLASNVFKHLKTCCFVYDVQFYFSLFLVCAYFELFEPTKTCIGFLRISVQISGRELRSETISCIFGESQYQNNPRLSWSLVLMLILILSPSRDWVISLLNPTIKNLFLPYSLNYFENYYCNICYGIELQLQH